MILFFIAIKECKFLYQVILHSWLPVPRKKYRLGISGVKRTTGIWFWLPYSRKDHRPRKIATGGGDDLCNCVVKRRQGFDYDHVCFCCLPSLENRVWRIQLCLFSLEVNKGIGVENLHYLNDGLWHMKPVKWSRIQGSTLVYAFCHQDATTFKA